MRRVVVDTSVFVAFFRGRPVARFEELIRANAVLLSPYVRMELRMGVRKAEARALNALLGGIPALPHRPEVFSRAESFVDRLKGTGFMVGLVDVLIAAEASLVRAAVFSLDAAFDRMGELGLVDRFD